MSEKKWFACEAKQERTVQLYVEAENIEDAKVRIKNDEWDDYDIMDENEGIKDINLESLQEVPAEEAKDDDCEDEDEDDED